MYDFTDQNDMQKAVRSMGGFLAKRAEELEKSYTFQTKQAEKNVALSDANKAMSKAHSDHAAAIKAQHDGLPDDHDMKAHMAKAHSHHLAMAQHHAGSADLHKALAEDHRAHAESMKAEIDAMKTMANEWGGQVSITKTVPTNGTTTLHLDGKGGVEGMLQETSEALMKKTLQTMENDPVVAEKLREICLKQIGTILGSKMVPDDVRSVIAPVDGGFGSTVRAVPRPGQPPIPERYNVPLEFEHLVKVDDEG